MEPIIAPSLLAADQSRLGHEVERAGQSGADWLHLDIMDGNFVPNISFGPQVVKDIRPFSKLFFDVHLMCVQPDILFEAFVQAGADQITIHIELGDRVPSLIKKIKALGKKVGLAVNPPTAIGTVQPYLEQVDLLLVMTVNPGFGGQKFMSETLPKMEQAKAWRSAKNLAYRINVDGGINQETAALCSRAGADTFVAGTSLFGAKDFATAVSNMRQSVQATIS